MAKAKILKFDAAGPGLSKSEILKVCDAENVRFLRLQFTDILGIIKNVEIPRSQFEKALDGEIQFDGSSIEGFTRIEESDMNLVPDLGLLRDLSRGRTTNGEKVGRLICDVYNPDGTPFAGCPRMTLKKQMDKASALGYTLVTGPEAEFFLFRRDANGDPIVDTHDEGGYFDLTPVDRGEEARRDIVLALEEMGFEVEAAHHEVAARPARDRLQVRRRRHDGRPRHDLPVRRQEGRDGPRPARDLHAQADLRRQRLGHAHPPVLPRQEGQERLLRRRRPSTSSRRPPCTTSAASCGTRRAFVAVTNPLVNSYKRLVPGYEAPINVAWSSATARRSSASRRAAAWARASRSACPTRPATRTWPSP